MTVAPCLCIDSIAYLSLCQGDRRSHGSTYCESSCSGTASVELVPIISTDSSRASGCDKQVCLRCGCYSNGGNATPQCRDRGNASTKKGREGAPGGPRSRNDRDIRATLCTALQRRQSCEGRDATRSPIGLPSFASARCTQDTYIYSSLVVHLFTRALLRF